MWGSQSTCVTPRSTQRLVLGFVGHTVGIRVGVRVGVMVGVRVRVHAHWAVVARSKDVGDSTEEHADKEDADCVGHPRRQEHLRERAHQQAAE